MFTVWARLIEGGGLLTHGLYWLRTGKEESTSKGTKNTICNREILTIERLIVTECR